MPPSIPPSAGILAGAPAAIMLDVAIADVVTPVTAMLVDVIAAEVMFFPVPLPLACADAVPVAEPEPEPEALVLVPVPDLLPDTVLVSVAEVVPWAAARAVRSVMRMVAGFMMVLREVIDLRDRDSDYEVIDSRSLSGFLNF
jgi:hypothetical protein